MQEPETRLTETFQAAGCDGCVHALDIDSGAAVGLHPHQLAVAASVIKVPVAVELYRQAAEEGLDLTEQVRLEPAAKTIGPTGLSHAQDTAVLSLRDLASLMLSISDNTATDAIIARVGLERVQERIHRLGLTNTVLLTNIQGLLDAIAQDCGVPALNALGTLALQERNARLDQAPALQPAHTTHTTPYDMTRLLQSIWLDRAAPANACEQVRTLLAQQISHRIAVGFPSEIKVSAKSGSLMGKVRNEIGVVTYPDNKRYAVAIFTTAQQRLPRQPKIDQAIGTAAALAVEALRTANT